ncbi:hypothetical protein BVH62_03245 [Vibrio cholerae]|nr:hypothetical protein [Vibrio cholerae]
MPIYKRQRHFIIQQASDMVKKPSLDLGKQKQQNIARWVKYCSMRAKTCPEYQRNQNNLLILLALNYGM